MIVSRQRYSSTCPDPPGYPPPPASTLAAACVVAIHEFVGSVPGSMEDEAWVREDRVHLPLL